MRAPGSDEKGHVVKEKDHLMDATRYLAVSGLGRATTDPRQHEKYGSDQGRQRIIEDPDPYRDM